MARTLFHNGRRLIEGCDWLDLGSRDIAVYKARDGDMFILDEVAYDSGVVHALDNNWSRMTLEPHDEDFWRRRSMKEAGLWTATMELGDAID